MLSFPTGIDVDSQGRVYVANQYDDDIHVYASGAAGDSAPIATIAGGGTQLSGPGALAVTPPLSILTQRLARAVADRPCIATSAWASRGAHSAASSSAAWT